jgi:cell wall-associated NlpC family hydrolase
MTSRHTRWMRRTALLACLLGAVVLAAGWLAIGAAGDDAPSARRAASSPAAGTSKLPPLPSKLRPKVVQPEAGAGSSPAAADEPASDPGLTDAAPAPKAAASTGGRRLNGVLRGVGGGVDKATALANGVALPPLEAPEAVRQIIEAGNSIARTPYKWGGGHGKWQDTGYDCSGSVSFALAAAGLLGGPLASGPLMTWGKAGKGKWVTIYANAGHVYLEVAGIRFDTSGARSTGSRWQNELRTNVGFVARHPPGL